MKLFGIKNCDTVKKARKWLETNQLAVDFHDFRDDGLDSATLEAWVDDLGWEALFNKRSTSFRALSDADKANLNAVKAQTLMLANPTLIKRPVLVHGSQIACGFSEAQYREIFGK
ncbi:ArsC family reductase [Shewanella cyperi]|uniref:ArsC family reductase n=1 Tax=Shewanella cyperi TaxID=2814292 RepID=UPI001A93CC19|nr:ArsC family reductase [Shewanella cyperi]QSX42620.1 ArsC family reductase [Shewanella cyperi]